VNLGVLHALDAIADLALEDNFFDFQPDLNKLMMDYDHDTPMGNLYPVILCWLSEEVCATEF